MKYTLTLSLIAVIHLTGSAQQSDVPVIQFQNTLIQTNPATAGLNYKRALNAVYHLGKLRYGHYNVSTNINYAARLDSSRSAIGISYMIDNWYELERTQAVLVHYAHHFRIGASSVLSVGVSGGVRLQKYDYYWIAAQTPNDPLLPSNVNQAQFQCNLGIAFHRKNLNTGVSVTQINSPKYKIGKNTTQTVAPDYWVFADYTFQLPANFELRPQIQVVTDGVRLRPYTSLMAIYNKCIWAGANYAYGPYFGGMAGVDIRQKIRIGVSYSLHQSEPHTRPDGQMFEVVLAYLLK